MLLDEPARRRGFVDDALARFPLESLSRLNRPYGEPDPELRPRVEAAQRAIRRLTAEGPAAT